MSDRIKILVTLMLVLSAPRAGAQDIWLRKDGSIRNIDTRAMVFDDGGLYLATRDEIYRARDVRDKWETIFSLPPGNNEVTCLAARKKNIYIGTKRGLYRSEDRGKSWRNVFRTIIPDKNNITSVELSGYDTGRMMIATARGLFSSDNSGESWRDSSGILKNRTVCCIALDGEYTFAGAEDGLYARKVGFMDWQKIYVTGAEEKGYGEELPESAEEIGYSDSGITCVELKGTRIYAGVRKRILFSDDRGSSWRYFSCDGLSGGINCLRVSPRSAAFYCATTKGVFEYSEERKRWIELYNGTDRAFNVKRLVFGGEGERDLWALTDNGLYRLEAGRYLQDGCTDIERGIDGFKMLFAGEPSYAQLQKAAMRFAEVGPEKIAQWRTQARMRALVPKVSFGMANRRSTNYEIYTSATKDYVVGGPDDLYNGLDVSVSWELGDIMYSDDQTNIDVRSRLTTQLRNDILDDLRRAYFERRRLQFELIQSPPQDAKLRFDKEMRIGEMTQAIDDLTGNYLSEHTVSDEKGRIKDTR